VTDQARLQEAPADLWNEEGSRVWIRHDLCENASKARYKAWKGDGLPIGLGDETYSRLIDLSVRVIWAHESPDGGYDEWPWKLCASNAKGAVKFWQVSIDD
jgi:hypothetical protein